MPDTRHNERTELTNLRLTNPFERLHAAVHDRSNPELLSRRQIRQQTGTFGELFGPDALSAIDWETLLRRMHGRLEGDSKCLAYWLEFKNDEEFEGYRFGSIGGGSALKFGLYQSPEDGTWLRGSPRHQIELDVAQAVNYARGQRDELIAGARVLKDLSREPLSDEAYVRLQAAMQAVAPNLHDTGWAHKYWFLCEPEKLESFHSTKYQRFYQLKMLQMPLDQQGPRSDKAGRFICAGWFVRTARELRVPVATLCNALGIACGGFHRYWKVGTTEGDTGVSHWAAMSEGGYAAIGWPKEVPDLTPFLTVERPRLRADVRDMLRRLYATQASATRKAGEVINFALEIAENDVIMACDGQTVLGVGIVRGSYFYDGTLAFPHLRPVEWLLLDPWDLPVVEGPRTTVFEMGRQAINLLELERRVTAKPRASRRTFDDTIPVKIEALPPLNAFDARVDAILRRKGQVIFYGPPGTGKTYRALNAAHELAARHAFHKPFESLDDAEREAVACGTGLVRVCTFHPGWGYEDFIEGLRPIQGAAGHLVFEPRDGIFKTICADALAAPAHNFYLVIDEINRGDLPRIFGELLTSIELDKRGRPVLLPATGATFVVPPNVFLIGTMNTADRSISLLDTAFRRRFGFVELMPDSAALGSREIGGVPLGPWLNALNVRVRKHLRRDARNLQIGHAYLMPQQPIVSVAEFARVLRDDIIPLLEEYCYDDFATLEQILGKALVDAEGGRIKESIFEAHQEDAFLQAVRFAEMEKTTLDQVDAEEDAAGAASDTAEEDEDEGRLA